MKRRAAAPLLLLALLGVLAAPVESCGRDPIARTIRELDRPALAFPLGIAPAPDGAIWIASTFADRLVRFEPESGKEAAVRLPLRSHPVGILVDGRGAVWFAASGLGLVGRLELGSKKAIEFAPPSLLGAETGAPAPWGITLDRARGEVWFSLASEGMVGRVGAGARPIRGGSVVKEVRLDGASRPEGIAADGRGGAWVAELAADRVSHVAADGSIRRVALARGSGPRGVAVAADGGVWVTLFGAHRLLRVDPSSLAVRAWPTPGGDRSNPYAVAVDGDGRVWLSELTANTVACFDPASERFVAWTVPTPRAAVRALAVDQRGRVWFAGSYGGRLGVISAPRRRRGSGRGRARGCEMIGPAGGLT